MFSRRISGIGLDELNTYKKNQNLVSFAEKVLAKELLRRSLPLQGILLGQRRDKTLNFEAHMNLFAFLPTAWQAESSHLQLGNS